MVEGVSYTLTHCILPEECFTSIAKINALDDRAALMINMQ